MSDSELLRSDVIGLLDSDPVPDPSDGLRTRARGLARQVAERASAAIPEGTPVGPYTVRGVLGRGGQAVVYRAEEANGRVVALKVPRAELLQRLIREAQILFLLDHPRVVRIERADVKGDVPWLACEYCPGGTLADRLKKGPIAPLEALALADQVLEALAHGHQKGVVHRDIKPSNVLFDAEGKVKVADFGVGSLALVEDKGGLPGTLVSLDRSLGAGTPVYMAPEQEHAALRVNGKVDGRADLYALGKVLYEALTGRTPRTVRPVSSLVPGLDPGWDAFIFKLLEDRPEQRPASAEEARQALSKLTALRDPLGAPAPTPPPLRDLALPPGGASRAAALLAFAIALVAVPGLWLLLALFGGHVWLLVALGVVLFELGLGTLILLDRSRNRRLAAGIERSSAELEQAIGPPACPDPVREVVSACVRMSRSRQGALIAFEREDSLAPWIERGTRLHAEVEENLLGSAFWPGSPLHDGAMVIRRGRIVGAACCLPLAAEWQVPSELLGARHRAAVGLSRQTDAVVVVVSQETGRISISARGQLRQFATAQALQEELGGLLAGGDWPPIERVEASAAARNAQLALPVSELGLSLRAMGCLEAAGILTIGGLVRMREQDLLALRNVGRVTLKEIEAKLRERGLALWVDEEKPREDDAAPAAAEQGLDALRLKPRRDPPRRTPRARRARLFFNEDEVDRINRALEDYQNLTRSSCNTLIDVEGHPVTQVGSSEGIYSLETLAALVAASFAATKEVAKSVGEPTFFRLEHEGAERAVQLCLVGERTLLATVHEPEVAALVRLHAKEVVRKLSRIFEEVELRKKTGKKLFAEGETEDVVDDLFGDP